MDDAADIYRIDRLPVRLLLLQIDRDRGLKISELRLCGDLCIRGAYIRKVCGLPALSSCDANTGIAIAISTAMSAMTISISINVNPLRFRFI